METGVSHNKQRLHKVGYFRELLASSQEIHENIRAVTAAEPGADRTMPENGIRLGEFSTSGAVCLVPNNCPAEADRSLSVPRGVRSWFHQAG
jgi:hypothetical protein